MDPDQRRRTVEALAKRLKVPGDLTMDEQTRRHAAALVLGWFEDTIAAPESAGQHRKYLADVEKAGRLARQAAEQLKSAGDLLGGSFATRGWQSRVDLVEGEIKERIGWTKRNYPAPGRGRPAYRDLLVSLVIGLADVLSRAGGTGMPQARKFVEADDLKRQLEADELARFVLACLELAKDVKLPAPGPPDLATMERLIVPSRALADAMNKAAARIGVTWEPEWFRERRLRRAARRYPDLVASIRQADKEIRAKRNNR